MCVVLLVGAERLYIVLRSCWVEDCMEPLWCYKSQHFDYHLVLCKVEQTRCGFCEKDGHDFGHCSKHGEEYSRPYCAHCRQGVSYG
ncbi:hypothetical protein PR048_012268 [Dryococelus australis]|uniref:Uncharacterized protein n=1 Tax=Dryococelus australis TaxID=614101 RepID=A0ABQ9HP07_9NEOP|nr:hypothetical protein PR048_012268 [Dryococelus australis]